jgi:hypothetical protein
MNEQNELPSGWSTPKPATMPPPTYWPMFLALGIVFVAYGIIFAWWFVGVGAAIFVIALGRWIGEIRRDRRREQSGEG